MSRIIFPYFPCGTCHCPRIQRFSTSPKEYLFRDEDYPIHIILRDKESG
ncbi:hypothetical protein ASZ90_015303 [hydrocarbon metagenome]|uniref:Uncharacterized protein n=1 Tax=hydrocarbon metagenome TaxID=938273 RepID=A0A0W8F2B3_9ZZZZ